MQRLLKKNDLFTVNCKTEKRSLKPGHLYVVTHTELTGGGTAHGSYDTYPDGHRVTAVRIDSRTSKSTGRPIQFYQSGCFTGMVYPDDVNHLGKAIQDNRYIIKFKL